MKDLYDKALSFVHLYAKALLVNAILCVICYGNMAFSQNIGIDTETVLTYPVSAMRWEILGRHGLLFSKYLLGFSRYNPYFEGVLFLAGFILLGSALAFFCWLVSGGNRDYPYGWFMVLFSVCPIWMTQFYFGLQRAEVVLAMLFAVISVLSFCEMIFFKKRKIYWYMLHIFFGIWSFCSYQGCAMFYIGMLIIGYLMDFFRDTEKKGAEYVKNILWLVVGFLTPYIANSILTVLFFRMHPYLSGQVLWGKVPLQENLMRIVGNVACALIWLMPEYVSIYPLSCICVLFLFVKYKGKNKPMLFLGLAGLMVTPFLLSIYLGNLAKARTQFVQPLAAAFACMLFWGVIGNKDEKKQVWIRQFSMFVAVAIAWYCVGIIFRFQYTDDVRYRQDVAMAEEIVEALHGMDGAAGLPVVFVGKREADLNGASVAADVFGGSFFKWDYGEENLTGASPRIIGFINALGIDMAYGEQFQAEALEAAKHMNSYPEDGYISVEGEYVAIKLSEVEDDEKSSGSSIEGQIIKRILQTIEGVGR